MITILSRYDTRRTFNKINNNLIKFKSFETLYYSCLVNNIDDLEYNDIDSIDPDGGPFICKGYEIKFPNEVFVVEKISNILYEEDAEYLEALLHVKKQN